MSARIAVLVPDNGVYLIEGDRISMLGLNPDDLRRSPFFFYKLLDHFDYAVVRLDGSAGKVDKYDCHLITRGKILAFDTFPTLHGRSVKVIVTRPGN